MYILITGANGQLGNELKVASKSHPKNTYYFTSKEELDITDYQAIQNFIQVNKINTIVNCAAYTNVDQAEDNFELANAINHLAVTNLSEIAKLYKIKLIHISTDYVFDGTSEKAYKETDITNPINVYGKTKLLGEQAMIRINPKNSIIIRTSWVYSVFQSNFVKTMIRLGSEKSQIDVVDNQFGSPTSANDLANVILEILPKINTTKIEIYHYSNTGMCSWYQFATQIMLLAKLNCIVKPINSSKFITKAKRPKYSFMDTSKIQKKYGIKIPLWEKSLEKMLLNNNLLDNN